MNIVLAALRTNKIVAVSKKPDTMDCIFRLERYATHPDVPQELHGKMVQGSFRWEDYQFGDEQFELLFEYVEDIVQNECSNFFQRPYGCWKEKATKLMLGGTFQLLDEHEEEEQVIFVPDVGEEIEPEIETKKKTKITKKIV